MTHFLWIDLETTGLHPGRCEIIEIAAVLTTKEMEVIAEHEAMVQSSGAHSWQPGALAMHAKNGLIERWADSEQKHPETIELGLLRMLDDHGANRAMLAGSSVHFDRGFIRRNMPMLHDALHYRHLDVSAITEMMRGLGYEPPAAPPSEHRAMSDIKRSIALYRHWREVVGPFSPCAPRV